MLAFIGIVMNSPRMAALTEQELVDALAQVISGSRQSSAMSRAIARSVLREVVRLTGLDGGQLRAEAAFLAEHQRDAPAALLRVLAEAVGR